MNDIQMIMDLGFTKPQAAEAYLVCDKNVELAISYLFDQNDQGNAFIKNYNRLNKQACSNNNSLYSNSHNNNNRNNNNPNKRKMKKKKTRKRKKTNEFDAFI